jgi:hypothetical protein
MTTLVVRVWLPDRPGALGAVASRIGAVKGDLVGIDILERGGGLAIDELVVDLPSADLVPMLVSEMQQVDGVDVEDVRPGTDSVDDASKDALAAAVVLVEQGTVDGLLAVLAQHAGGCFGADWAVVVDVDGSVALASAGAPPPAAWLGAFLAGSRSSERVASGECGPDDMAWATLPTPDLALLLGRRGRPFRSRERRQLAALARIAECRWLDLTARAGAGA